MLQLISFGGLAAMVALAWLMSSNRARFPWRLTLIGVGLQFVFAAIVFHSQQWTFPLADGTPRYPNGILFFGVEQFFQAISRYVEQGATFVFQLHTGDTASDPLLLLKSFAFGVLPTVIFFAALMSVLYYVGVMQGVVRAAAWVMQRTMGTSGAESLAAAANIFVGHTEAPLVIRPFVAGMTRSELDALMVGGFATISGSLMAVFVAQGISAGHLLTASIISAPPRW